MTTKLKRRGFIGLIAAAASKSAVPNCKAMSMPVTGLARDQVRVGGAIYERKYSDGTTYSCVATGTTTVTKGLF